MAAFTVSISYLVDALDADAALDVVAKFQSDAKYSIEQKIRHACGLHQIEVVSAHVVEDK